MALSENYRTETIGRSDCRPIVRLSADTIVRWDYRPNSSVECVDVVAGQCKWAAKRWEKSPPAAVPAVKQIVYSRRCRATSLFFIDNLY